MDDQLHALTAIFTEFYYRVAIVLMFLIHAGFCLYEVGASRRKNRMHTLMKNTMILPLVSVSFFCFGWWIYCAWPNGPGITGGLVESNDSLAWSPFTGSRLQGVSGGGAFNGVVWAAFLLFSWTAASIVSGALIERIRLGAFWILAVTTGSFTWLVGAAWGWHPDGWMVQLLGYHDAYGAGAVHVLAGGFALGVLCVLGPRIGKFSLNGSPRRIVPHNPWLVTIGLFLIYTGFWGFYAAANIPLLDLGEAAGMKGSFWSTTTIYHTPTTTSAITFNFLMALSGGLLMGYLVSKGDAFWTYSCGLGGIVAASAGNDLYHPVQAMFVAMIAVPVFYNLHFWAERTFRIDDGVGAIAVHGYAGCTGLLISGVMLWGYPASLYYPSVVSPWGQLCGAVIMFLLLGFAPAYGISTLLHKMGILRMPERLELAGLDTVNGPGEQD